ncbi:MAG: hypothetical protein U0165_06315 [Polyangiaceae bacterium]
MLKPRSRQEPVSEPASQVSLAGQALAGLVEAGVIMAASDGHIAHEEMAVVAGIIDGFCQGHASEDEIKALMVDAGKVIDRDGIDVRLQKMTENLFSPELRRLGMLVAASVMICDGEFAAGREDHAYLAMAKQLGFSTDEARAILDEAGALFD